MREQWDTESAEKMYSAEEVTDEDLKEVPFFGNIHFFWLETRGGQQMLPPPPRSDLIYLDSLLMTLMRAPFSSFSL